MPEITKYCVTQLMGLSRFLQALEMPDPWTVTGSSVRSIIPRRWPQMLQIISMFGTGSATAFGALIKTKTLQRSQAQTAWMLTAIHRQQALATLTACASTVRAIC